MQEDTTFEIQNLQCNDKDDFPGQADINEEPALAAIDNVCYELKHDKSYMSPGNEPLVKEENDWNTNKHQFT